MYIVTGYTGIKHVTSADQRATHAAFMGEDRYVLQSGGQLMAEVKTSNLVELLDGDIMNQGCLARIEPGKTEEAVIENGTVGNYRYDIIYAAYERDIETGIESIEIRTKKGISSTVGYIPPDMVSGVIRDGAALDEMPLWGVKLNGLTVEGLDKLHQVFLPPNSQIGNLEDLSTTEKDSVVDAVNEVKSEADQSLQRAGVALGSYTVASGSTSKVITDGSIMASNTCLVDVYYSEAAITPLKDNAVSYAITAGTLTITFEVALSVAIVIENIIVRGY